MRKLNMHDMIKWQTNYMHNFTLIFHIYVMQISKKGSQNIIKIINSDFPTEKSYRTKFLLDISTDETAIVQWKTILSKISQQPLIVSSIELVTEV